MLWEKEGACSRYKPNPRRKIRYKRRCQMCERLVDLRTNCRDLLLWSYRRQPTHERLLDISHRDGLVKQDCFDAMTILELAWN